MKRQKKIDVISSVTNSNIEIMFDLEKTVNQSLSSLKLKSCRSSSAEVFNSFAIAHNS